MSRPHFKPLVFRSINKFNSKAINASASVEEDTETKGRGDAETSPQFMDQYGSDKTKTVIKTTM
ncbi:hypothetical protein AMR41_19810 [Hapalosiphon sp. MRB220]|nr:hypothetical protein AMR41_19810 [Hapalosiphon sp. MRB220]